MAEITEVLARLLERTDQGKVNWKTTANEKTFATVVGNASVTVSTQGEYGPVILRVLDKTGRELEMLSSSVREGEKLKDRLWELHDKARRIALGVDSQLGDLLKQLEAT